MTEWITRLVNDLGYVGLAFLTFLENVFPPLPSEIIMPLGGFLASQGRLTLVGVVLAGVLGSIAGSLVLFALGRQFDEKRLKKWTVDYGHWLLLSAEDMEKAFDWFDRHGRKAVFLARLVPGVRSLISIPAGICKMGLVPFILYTALGTAIWSGALAYGGMALGTQYERLGQVVRWATYVVIALAVLAIARWLIQRRRETEI